MLTFRLKSEGKMELVTIRRVKSFQAEGRANTNAPSGNQASSLSSLRKRNQTSMEKAQWKRREASHSER